MALDNESLVFNLDKNFNIFNLNAKQFDTSNARSFTFCLVQDGVPFDLTGISVKVGGIKPDGKKFFNDISIVDLQKGVINLTLTGQMLAVEGIIRLEFLFFKNDIRLSSYPFEINVIPSITDFAAIQSSDEFGALTEALGKVNGTLENVENKVNEAVNDLKGNNIGTVNLLTGTQWFDNGWYVGYGTACSIDRVNLFEGCAVLTSTYDWTYYCQDFNYYEIGKQYTISCYAKSDNGKAQISFTVASDKVAWQRTTTTTSWEKYSITFIATQPTGNVRVENCGTKDGADKIHIAKIKLEKGVVATDWNPNSLDYKTEIGNGDNLLSKYLVTTDRVAYEVSNLEKGKFYTLDLGDIEFNGTSVAIYDFEIDYIGNHAGLTQEILGFTSKITGTYTFQITGNINKTKKYHLVFWGGGINNVFNSSNRRIKLENGFCSTGYSDVTQNLQNECIANTKQIVSNSNSISDIKHNWISDCSNSLCINGFTSLKVYAEGVYYITGEATSELSEIDHSALENGQKVYFISETNTQTAAIKFCQGALANCGVYTPKGADFWITGRDNGDTIYIMQKIGGALRFRSL